MRIRVNVKPKAKYNKIEKLKEGEFIMWVTEAPEKGRANRAVLRALARHLKISQSALTLIMGEHARVKVFEVII